MAHAELVSLASVAESVEEVLRALRPRCRVLGRRRLATLEFFSRVNAVWHFYFYSKNQSTLVLIKLPMHHAPRAHRAMHTAVARP